METPPVLKMPSEPPTPFPLASNSSPASYARWVELLSIFGVVPLVVGYLVPPMLFLPVLWLAGLFAWLALRRKWVLAPAEIPVVDFFSAQRWRAPVIRFVFSTVLVTAAVATWMPERFLRFPRERPGFWLAVMLLYPLLSVYPQELIYRRVFFARYAGLFVRPRAMIIASAIVFGWVHVIFRNPYAIGLTLVGGYFFADTYARSRSLRIVCLEHAAYGCMVFTVGLGEFFI
jgi:hypothetical protein